MAEGEAVAAGTGRGRGSTAPTRGRYPSVRETGSGTTSARRSQPPLVHRRDGVLDPRRQAASQPRPRLLRRRHRELDGLPIAGLRDGELDARGGARDGRRGGRGFLIVHSDRGCRYRWPDWLDTCREAGIQRSISHKGSSPDNSRMEGRFEAR